LYASLNSLALSVATDSSAIIHIIFFKKDGIGGHFKNGTVIHNGGQITADGAIHSVGTVDIANVSFENVTLTSADGLYFTGDSAAALEGVFDADATNIKN